MPITPSTNVRILKIPIEIDNKNQLTFSSVSDQTSYFLGISDHIEINDSQYQRKDGILYFPENIDSIINYNYCMYQNENYSNKWFYAFITNMEYENDGTTRIYLETDVFQTWQFDLTWKQSFIEREHVSVANDLIGANRLPEDFETGEYVVNKSYNVSELSAYYVIAYVGNKIKRTGGDISVGQNGYKYNGLYSSVTFIVCNDTGFATMMGYMAEEDNSNNILTIFTIPKVAYSPPDTSSFYTDGYFILTQNYYNTPTYINSNLLDALTTSFKFEGLNALGYTPKNRKLLQYPYVYLGLNPPMGDKRVYRYEDFNNFQPDFTLCSEINPNPSVMVIPNGYRQKQNTINAGNTEDMAALNGYPTISYKTDVYNTWLAQNGSIINLSMQQENLNYQQQKINAITGQAANSINAGIGTTSNIASGNLGGSIGSYLSGLSSSLTGGANLAIAQKNHELNVKMQMAQIEKQKLLPDNATLTSSNATTLGYGYVNHNIFTQYCIREEYARRIDKFFDMYGYLTNMVKLPNLSTRSNWNYVKTIGANIVADIPQIDLQKIKDIFDNGVTLWHNPSTFLDYSQTNS